MRNFLSLKKRLELIFNREDIKHPGYRVRIASYNLADLTRFTVYNEFYGKDKNIHKHHVKSFAADALIQVMLTILSLDLDLEEVMELGLDRMNEQVYKFKARKE